MAKKGFPNTDAVNIGCRSCYTGKASLRQFGLEYEAYHLDNNFYFSDSAFIKDKKGKRVRWNPGELRLESFKQEDKIIILIHPEHWDYSMHRKFLKHLHNRFCSRAAIEKLLRVYLSR